MVHIVMMNVDVYQAFDTGRVDVDVEILSRN